MAEDESEGDAAQRQRCERVKTIASHASQRTAAAYRRPPPAKAGAAPQFTPHAVDTPPLCAACGGGVGTARGVADQQKQFNRVLATVRPLQRAVSELQSSLARHVHDADLERRRHEDEMLTCRATHAKHLEHAEARREEVLKKLSAVKANVARDKAIALKASEASCAAVERKCEKKMAAMGKAYEQERSAFEAALASGAKKSQAALEAATEEMMSELKAEQQQLANERVGRRSDQSKHAEECKRRAAELAETKRRRDEALALQALAHEARLKVHQRQAGRRLAMLQSAYAELKASNGAAALLQLMRRRQLERRRDERGRAAAMRLQAAARRRLARLAFERERSARAAALRIQSSRRSRVVRQEFLAKRGAAMLLQSAFADRLSRFRAVRALAATRMQAAGRGMNTRRRSVRQHQAAVRVQTATRGRSARIEVREAIDERRRHVAYWQQLYAESQSIDSARDGRSLASSRGVRARPPVRHSQSVSLTARYAVR